MARKKKVKWEFQGGGKFNVLHVLSNDISRKIVAGGGAMGYWALTRKGGHFSLKVLLGVLKSFV